MGDTEVSDSNMNGRALRKLELMQSVLGVITNRKLSVDEQINELLRTGCELFDEDIGIVSRIEGQKYIVAYVHCRNDEIQKGQEFELGNTFCAITVNADGPLGISDVKKSEWNTHPCIKTGLESYIGIPVYVESERYGTLNFSSAQPKSRPFPDVDLEFITTLGDWVSMVLSRHLMVKDLRLQANYDSLTGLTNRKSFMKRLTVSLERTKHNPEYSFAVLFIDLDKFKQVNDTHGHKAGDTVLQTVAQRLEIQVRPKDGISRLGGDEFTVLLEDVPVGWARTAARRIHKSIIEPVEIEEGFAYVGVSIGIAMNQDFANADELMEAADSAMYHAKKNKMGICIIGRDGFSCIDEE